MKKKFKDFLKETAYIDKNGNLMDFNFEDDRINKNNIYVKIQESEDGLSDAEITFWKKNNDSMVDEHILDLYPEIGNRDDYDDGGEGYLSYYGDMKIPQLKEYFRKLGFEVRD